MGHSRLSFFQGPRNRPSVFSLLPKARAKSPAYKLSLAMMAAIWASGLVMLRPQPGPLAAVCYTLCSCLC